MAPFEFGRLDPDEVVTGDAIVPGNAVGPLGTVTILGFAVVTSADSKVNETEVAEGVRDTGRKNGEAPAVAVWAAPFTEGSRAKPAIPSITYPEALKLSV